jgi:hypothetical protein
VLLRTRYWETIVLSIIGEMLEPEENGDEICGAVMSKRKTGDRIAVWNRRNNQPQLIMAMGKVGAYLVLSLLFLKNAGKGHSERAFDAQQQGQAHVSSPRRLFEDGCFIHKSCKV